jgi:hypothetical protein
MCKRNWLLFMGVMPLFWEICFDCRHSFSILMRWAIMSSPFLASIWNNSRIVVHRLLLPRLSHVLSTSCMSYLLILSLCMALVLVASVQSCVPGVQGVDV